MTLDADESLTSSSDLHESKLGIGETHEMPKCGDDRKTWSQNNLSKSKNIGLRLLTMDAHYLH